MLSCSSLCYEMDPIPSCSGDTQTSRQADRQTDCSVVKSALDGYSCECFHWCTVAVVTVVVCGHYHVSLLCTSPHIYLTQQGAWLYSLKENRTVY